MTEPVNACKEAALEYIKQGLSVIPLEPFGKRPLAAAFPDGHWGEYRKRVAAPEEVEKWFEWEPQANIALVCGKVSGLIVVDINGGPGCDWCKRFLPKTDFYQHSSGVNNYHAFYKLPDGVEIQSLAVLSLGVSVLGEGSYAVCVPSVHKTGALYSPRALKSFKGFKNLPPFPAMAITQMGDKNAIQQWVEAATGEFTVTELDRDLGITRPKDKASRLATLQALVADGTLEPVGKSRSRYRIKDRAMHKIDLSEVAGKPFALNLPYGLSRMVEIQEKNVAVIAGETNSGKTALLFNLAWMNQGVPIRYLSSEMTGVEVQNRIRAFSEDMAMWKHVEFVHRVDDFHDVINPDGVNIIDFMEIYGEFWTIGSKIKAVFDALRTGVAFIAIQKRTGELFGRGGEFTIEKARLAMSLFTHGRLSDGIIGSCKVTKAKNFKPGANPEGREIFYQLQRGYYYDCSKIDQIYDYQSGWRYYAAKEREKLKANIEQYCKSRSKHQPQFDTGFYGDMS